MFKLKNKKHSNKYVKNISQPIIVSPPYGDMTQIPPKNQQYFEEKN